MRRFLAFLLFVPGALSAQSRTSASGYLAADPGVAGNPLMVGITVAEEHGVLAARLGVGFDVSAPPEAGDAAAPAPATGIWSTDADALIYLRDPGAGAALVPFGVVGVGTRGFTNEGSLGLALNYSYGAGFRAPMGGGFAMEGEARYRDSFVEFAPGELPVVDNGVEFRFGVNLGLGGGQRLAPRLPAIPTSLPRASSAASGGIFTSASSGSASAARVAAATLTTAERYIGVKYTWGGNTPEQGFDCSGFIRYVFALQGITLPRVSRDQAQIGTMVPLDIRQFEPGDLIAFASDGRNVDHIAIYAGRGRILHSSSSGRGVRYDDLYSSRGTWYVEHMVAARRVIDERFALSR